MLEQSSYVSPKSNNSISNANSQVIPLTNAQQEAMKKYKARIANANAKIAKRLVNGTDDKSESILSTYTQLNNGLSPSSNKKFPLPSGVNSNIESKTIVVTKTKNANGTDKYTAVIQSPMPSSSSVPGQQLTPTPLPQTHGGRRKRSHRKRSHKRTHKRSHKSHKRIHRR